MKCIIVDDESLARQGIELHVNDTPFLEIVGQFENAMLASDFLSSNEVDLIFLDIEMPGLNGLDFLKSLKGDYFVILTTAYPQFALEAFELQVVDYLVKPISFQRFHKSVTKAKEFWELSKQQDVIESVEEDFVYIKSDRKYVKLFFKDIKFIKGLKDYVMIHTDAKKYATAMNVKTILAQLPKEIFARVSKSYVVNINRIQSIEVDSIYVEGEEIPLGMSYKEPFLKTHVQGRLLKR